jgi:hypothetical protein
MREGTTEATGDISFAKLQRRLKLPIELKHLRYADAAERDESFRNAADATILRTLAQRVEVVDGREVRIMGWKSELLRTLVAAARVETAGFGVRSFMPKWRARHDSNMSAMPWEREVTLLSPVHPASARRIMLASWDFRYGLVSSSTPGSRRP